MTYWCTQVCQLFCLTVQGGPAYKCSSDILSSTAIGSRKYRIPSDLRSQAGYRLVSTMVGDHMGILGVVVFDFCMYNRGCMFDG